jgi:uncharacterized membrane protein YwaF
METQTVKKNEDFLAQIDVMIGMYPTRNEGDYRFTTGQDEIIGNYASLTAINDEIRLAEIAQKEAQQNLENLNGLILKKVNSRKEVTRSEEQELQEKEKALDKARKHYDTAKKRYSVATLVEPAKQPIPKKNKSNYAKDILEIVIIDMLVLLSQWSVLRQSLSVDQLFVRSALVLAISILTLQVKIHFRKSGQIIHKVFYFICALMIISSVFSTVALDMLYPSNETVSYDNFSLTEVVVEQAPSALLDKYRENPGLPELFVAFLIFIVSGTLILKANKNTDEKPQEKVCEVSPIQLCQMEIDTCTKDVSDCRDRIYNNKREFAAELERLKNKIKECTKRIDDIKQRITKFKTEFNKVFNQLWGQLTNYEEAWKKHMAIELEVAPEGITFESVTKEDIYKHFNIN